MRRERPIPALSRKHPGKPTVRAANVVRVCLDVDVSLVDLHEIRGSVRIGLGWQHDRKEGEGERCLPLTPLRASVGCSLVLAYGYVYCD